MDQGTLDKLKGYVSRIEELEHEKQGIMEVLKDVYADAKCDGFDVQAIRDAVRLRKKGEEFYKDALACLDLYLDALKSGPSDI